MMRSLLSWWNERVLANWKMVLFLYMVPIMVLAATVPVCIDSADGCSNPVARFFINVFLFSMNALFCATIPAAILMVRLVYRYYNLFLMGDTIPGKVSNAVRGLERRGTTFIAVDVYTIKYTAPTVTTVTGNPLRQQQQQQHEAADYLLAEKKVLRYRYCGCSHEYERYVPLSEAPQRYQQDETVHLKVLASIGLPQTVVLQDDLAEHTPCSILFFYKIVPLLLFPMCLVGIVAFVMTTLNNEGPDPTAQDWMFVALGTLLSSSLLAIYAVSEWERQKLLHRATLVRTASHTSDDDHFFDAQDEEQVVPLEIV